MLTVSYKVVNLTSRIDSGVDERKHFIHIERPNGVSSGRYASYRKKWGNTKKKLLERWDLPSLDFKPWPNDGPDCCSVRIDDKFRGHLRHEGGGHWLAYKLGPHTAMGHG